MTITRFIQLVIFMSLAAGASACASADSLVALPGDSGTITRGALRAINAHWSRVELGNPRSATCPGAGGVPPASVRGDINGDGLEDIVVWVSVEGTPRLAALLTRLDGEYTLVDVGGADINTAGPVILDLGRRGTGYRLTEDGVDLFFGADTIVLRGCDGARTGWFWSGSAFYPQALAN
jgi:hypothetical protein